MYKVSTIMDLLRRGRRKHKPAAIAMAALLFFSALATARAQGTYAGPIVLSSGTTIGLAPGQTVDVTVPNVILQDGSVRFFKTSIRVYDRDSTLLYKNVWINEGQHELGHIFTIGYDNLGVPGEARKGRRQIWIEVESFSLPPAQAICKFHQGQWCCKGIR